MLGNLDGLMLFELYKIVFILKRCVFGINQFFS